MQKLLIKDLQKMNRTDLTAIIAKHMGAGEYERSKGWVACWTKQDMIDEVAKYQNVTRRTMPKPTIKAVWAPCPGITDDGVAAHAMRDYCGSCAPYWEKYPTCPTHGKKVTQTGYCKEGRHHIDISNRE